MTIAEKTRELIQKVKALRASETLQTANRLASNCYFLNADEILCDKRNFGDARYPYSCDGLTLWAYSSGNVKIEESMFNVILSFTEGKRPNLCFYAGRKRGDGYFPISLTGAGKLPFEESVLRYTVFTPDAAYYITEAPEFTACVRMFIDGEKNVRLTAFLQNETDGELQTYASAFINCMLSRAGCEGIETKWYRRATATERGFQIGVTEYLDRTTCFENRLCILRDAGGKAVNSTTSYTDFCGGMHEQIVCSTSLQNGKFEVGKKYTEFTDTAIAGDIIPLCLQKGESYAVSYTLTLGETGADTYKTQEIDAWLYREKTATEVGRQIPETSFTGGADGLSGGAFGSFLKNVFRQAEFCARAKNYAGPYIGIRDIFQQLEAAQIWIPEYCRGKIVEALNYIGEDGRAPRQYSYPAAKNVLPAMDLRPYIDQGVWIISTVYNYLSQTDDFSILDEECGYYKFDGYRIDFSADRDSVLCHLLRITDYLISNLDEETDCLHALYGDWNDALDGLGKTDENGKEYGTGVSVMATLQLYRNLQEISDILKRVGRENEASRYETIREKVKNGLLKYAVVDNGAGERKILHGWGDKREYFVASYKDNDGENRDGLTANAYWVISRAIDFEPSLKKDILAAYARLDSKYGLKTFEPYFARENTKVGRITRLPKGTAENGATYIHATLFGIWSLFEMGEAEKAWEQLYKILPITHKLISTTPFVMPNSYVENAEKGFDGESMSDWFTGSGCVLLKVLVWYVFGVRAGLDGVTVSPAAYLPFASGEITLNVKGKAVKIVLEKSDKEREFFVNGKRVESVFDEKTGVRGVYFTTEAWQSIDEILVKG